MQEQLPSRCNREVKNVRYVFGGGGQVVYTRLFLLNEVPTGIYGSDWNIANSKFAGHNGMHSCTIPVV